MNTEHTSYALPTCKQRYGYAYYLRQDNRHRKFPASK